MLGQQYVSGADPQQRVIGVEHRPTTRSGGADDRDRAVGAVENGGADRAQCEPGEGATAAGADYEEIRSAGSVDEGPGGHVLSDDFGDGDRRVVPARAGEQAGERG